MSPRSRSDDESDHDRPRRRKKKAKKGGGALVAVFVILGLLVLGGAGVGAFFLFRNTAGGGSALEDACDKLLGDWEAPAPERPNQAKIYLQVAAKSIRISAGNATGKMAGGDSFEWKSLRMSGKSLVIHQEGHGQSFDWSIEFVSNDQMQVTSLTSPDAPLRAYSRIGKFVTKEERQQGAEKNRLRLVGKWEASSLEHALRRKAVFEFRADGTAKFDYYLHDRDKLEPYTGTWKALEGKDNELKIQLTVLAEHDKMHIEFRSDTEIAFSFYSATMGGVQLSARRLGEK